MRILVWADGTRGDVLPVISLARGLQDAGYRVRFATHPSHGVDAAAAGLEGVPIHGNDPRAVSGAVQAGTVGRSRRRRLWHHLFRRSPPSPAQLDGMVAMCRDADAVLSTIGFAIHPAEAAGARFVRVALYPTEPTGERPHHLSRLDRSWGAPVNRLTHFLIRQLFWQPERRWINDWRRELGLRPWGLAGSSRGGDGRPVPHLYGYSAAVVPRPGDWGGHLAVTGYWWPRVPPDEGLDGGLEAFLRAGPPPVLVGFGSLVDPDPEALRGMLRAAAAGAGVRVVALAGWSGGRPDGTPEGWWVADWVPIARLLPRCAAMIHHAGAGTTAEVLRAGLPSVTIPYSGEQRFWAGRLAALGAAPPALPRTLLRPDSLVRSLREAVANPAFRTRAAEVAGTLAGEDGVGTAVAAVRRWLGGP